MGLFSKIKDLALGKKDTGSKGGYVDLDKGLSDVTDSARNKQLLGLEIYQDELRGLKKDTTEDLLKREQAKRLKLAGQAAQDNIMKTKQMLAQRGMGKSLSGMRMLMNAENRGLENVADIRADKVGLEDKIRGRRVGRLGQLSGGVNQIINAQGAQRAYQKAVKGKGRGGGLLKMGLMGAGGAGAFIASGGNPAAVGPGMQMGSGMGTSLANL